MMADRREWKAVKDGYPKCAGWYLVALKDGTVTSAYFEVAKLFSGETYPNWVRFNNDSVTHWMPYPLHPALPRKEANDEVGEIRWV